MNPPKKSSTSISRITQLPADVIGNILIFLPTKEAVRTSILSSQWRHHWRTIPHLVFDHKFATMNNSLCSTTDKVMLRVYQALMFHDGPINKFQLSIPGLPYCSQLHQVSFSDNQLCLRDSTATSATSTSALYLSNSRFVQSALVIPHMLANQKMITSLEILNRIWWLYSVLFQHLSSSFLVVTFCFSSLDDPMMSPTSCLNLFTTWKSLNFVSLNLVD
ncbi:F-box/FBD/LRR-repeat protein At1g13570 [Linum grandiflorum]